MLRKNNLSIFSESWQKTRPAAYIYIGASMARLTKKQEKSVLDGLTLMDDALFTMCFDGSAECASVMLSVLLCRDDLAVTEATTQKWIEGADKHSVKLDIYARDREGNIYDIEIQRASKGAGSRRRARFYSAMIDSDALRKGTEYNELPESYVIFITERDAIGRGKAVYEFDRYMKGTWEPFGDGTHILFISADLADRDTDLGRLMEDLRCPDPERMHYRELRDRVGYFKNDKEGRIEMSGEFERILNKEIEKAVKETRESCLKEGKKEAAMSNARTMIADGTLPLSKIAKFSGLSIGEVESIRNSIKA